MQLPIGTHFRVDTARETCLKGESQINLCKV